MCGQDFCASFDEWNYLSSLTIKREVRTNRVVALKNFRCAPWRAEHPKSACLRPSGARPSFALFSVASHCCAGNFSERLFSLLHFLVRHKKVETHWIAPVRSLSLIKSSWKKVEIIDLLALLLHHIGDWRICGLKDH